MLPTCQVQYKKHLHHIDKVKLQNTNGGMEKFLGGYADRRTVDRSDICQ